MIIFDSDGKFIDAWGEGVFTNPHGIYIGPDDRVYAADNFDHTVRIFEPDGTLLQTLGEKDKPSDTGFVPGKSPVTQGAGPFNRVTNLALSASESHSIPDLVSVSRTPCTSPGTANAPASLSLQSRPSRTSS